MKYFLDTEFHEYQKKPLFSKPIDTIELISIGIVSEEFDSMAYFQKNNITIKDVKNITIDNDNERLHIINDNTIQKEYYAICKEFDLKTAWNNEWLRENVLKQLLFDWYKATSGTLLHKLVLDTKELEQVWNKKPKACRGWLRLYLDKYGKTRKQIAEEIKDFILPVFNIDKDANTYWTALDKKEPEFYAYYADYDWVVFCWLFGRMIDLPKGFPMFAFDLQQYKHDAQESRIKLKEYIDNSNGVLTKHEEHTLVKPLKLEDHPNYPKQINEHNALDDAKFNYELYKFLKTI